MKKPKYKWEKQDLNLLKSLYLFFSNKDLGRIFGLSDRTIHNILGRYGLYRNRITDSEFRNQISKNIPTIIIKPLSRYEEDVLKLDEIVSERVDKILKGK